MRSLKGVAALVAAGVALGSLAGCGSKGSSSEAPATAYNNEKVTLTVWGWGSQWEPALKGFKAKYPNITVKFNNTGTASDTATALSNAVQAGSGAPDVVTLEDANVSQFALSGALEDVSAYGAAKVKGDFAAGPVSKLTVDSKMYGMPIDSAPMVFFYNKTIFEKAGVSAAPTTWDEYLADAQKIKALGGGHYITNDTGDKDSFSPFNAMLWEAGAHPNKIDGDKVTINLTSSDPGVKKYTDFKQKLIDGGLLDTKSKQWSDDWFRGLGDGTIASLAIGAWMPVNLETSAPKAKGQWRVAPLPQWEAGRQTSSEDGGSALSIVKSSQKKAAAWTLVNYMTHGDGAKISVDKGGVFPSLKSILNSSEFKDQSNAYFGGQKVNAVLADAANLPVETYQFLPYNAYAQSVYGDIVGKAYSGKETLAAALKEYQDNLVQYGNNQGFTVNK